MSNLRRTDTSGNIAKINSDRQENNINCTVNFKPYISLPVYVKIRMYYLFSVYCSIAFFLLFYISIFVMVLYKMYIFRSIVYLCLKLICVRKETWHGVISDIGDVLVRDKDPSIFTQRSRFILPTGSATFYPPDPPHFTHRICYVFTHRIRHILLTGFATFYPLDPPHFTHRIRHILPTGSDTFYGKFGYRSTSKCKKSLLSQRVKLIYIASFEIKNICLTRRIRNPGMGNILPKIFIHTSLFSKDIKS